MTHTIKSRGGAAWRVCRLGGFLSGVMIAAALTGASSAEASTYRWQADASGDWNVPGNWELVEGPAGAGYPNLPGDVAVFDEPLTASRTVTIPDTVTVTIGRLTVAGDPDSARITIERTGTGLLVFDNLGDDAVIESTGEVNVIPVATPIELAADVTINGVFQIFRISEAGGSRSVTVTAGHVELMQPNTYTGTTTLVDGVISTSSTAIGARIPGALVVGDGAGAVGSAQVLLNGDSIAHTADVQVNADGQLSFSPNAVPMSDTHTIDGLTVADGSVDVTGSSLNVQDLTMEGGTITLPLAPAVLNVSGNFTLTSTAAETAVIRSAPIGNQVPASLRLTAGNHDFTVADGPQAVDFEILLITIGETAPGAALTKLGPGVMRTSSEVSYTGATSVTAGELIFNGSATSSAFTVSAAGTLSGNGTVGALTTQAGSHVRPGTAPLTGILRSGAANLGGTLDIDINGPEPGNGYDQLAVTGTVSLTGATLALAGTPVLTPLAVLTIIDNDGSDPVSGTFTGLPEGAEITVGQTTFAISYAGGDGNDVVLANTAPLTYFLSEGATGTFFDEDVVIANPNMAPAPVTMTFFLQGGGTVVHQASVPAQSRLTVAVDEIEGLEATSASVEVRSDSRLPLAVERTMFWDSTHYGGHTANSVPSAEREWFFAEGAQNDFFNTYLLLANPAGAQTATVTFLRENEPPFVLEVELAAQSRTTVSAGDHPELVGRSFGIQVEAPAVVTAERAMYFATTPERLWNGGHDNVGSPAAATSWFHPEGASGTFFTTFILMSNPQDVAANVTLRFLLQSGAPVEITKSIGAQQRLTINPAAEGIFALQNASFSTVVTSDVPIVSERAMYWNTDDTFFGEGHASSGLTAPAHAWVLAEGRVGGDNAYTTYILLANPDNGASSVTVTFLRESGTPVVENYVVPANSRFNIDVGAMVPALQNESFGTLIQVTAGAAIAVERSMYWNVDGRFWSGGTNAVGAVVPQQ